MQVVGAQWLMLTLTHSTTFVALIQTASALPVMLFSVSAGVISDLIDRCRFLPVAQTHADCSGDAWHTCAGRGGDAVGAAYPGLRRRCRSRVCVTDVELVAAPERQQAISLGAVNMNITRAIG